MNYSQKANPDATNSELDAKRIVTMIDSGATSEMTDSTFIEEIYEIAFGEDAINRDFSHDEVIEQIREFSDNALEWEESGLDLDQLHNISEEMEKTYRQGYRDGRNFNADDVAKCIVDTNGGYAECVDQLVDSMNPTFHMDKAFDKLKEEDI